MTAASRPSYFTYAQNLQVKSAHPFGGVFPCSNKLLIIQVPKSIVWLYLFATFRWFFLAGILSTPLPLMVRRGLGVVLLTEFCMIIVLGKNTAVVICLFLHRSIIAS